MDRDPALLLKLLRFNRLLLERLLEGIPESAFDEPMPGGGNTPRWVLLHLAAMFDVALRNLQRPTMLPPEHVNAYGPGSDGVAGESFPTAEARKLLDRVLDAVESAVAELEDVEKAEALRPLLDRHHRAPILAGTSLETVGDATSHLLTTHLAFHLGQISLVRRRCGLRPVI